MKKHKQKIVTIFIIGVLALWSAPVFGAFLDPPLNLKAECNSDGTSVALSWTSTRADHTHDLRVDFKPNNGPSCRDGWYCSDPPDKLVRIAGTSLTMAVTPGTDYDWWVHSVWADSRVGAPSRGSFTCQPTPKGSISVNPLSVEICPPATSGTTTISGNANVPWAVRTGGSSGPVINSGSTPNFSFSATVTNKTTFYLTPLDSTQALDSEIVNIVSAGCPAEEEPGNEIPAGCTDVVPDGIINEQDCGDSRNNTCTLCSGGETSGETCNNDGDCDAQAGEDTTNCSVDCQPEDSGGGASVGGEGYKPPKSKEFKFGIADKIGLGTPEGLAGRISNWIFNLAIPTAMALIIWAGVRMLTASGNEQQFRTGATMLRYTLIGLAVIFIGRGFVSLVQSILGGGS